MEQDPGSALAEFVRASGPDSLDDPRRVRAMLRDAAPSSHLEVSLLVAALEEGVGQRLARSSSSLVGGEIDRLSSDLVQRRGIAPDHAQWAVRTVAWALGRAPQPAPQGGPVTMPEQQRGGGRPGPEPDRGTWPPAEQQGGGGWEQRPGPGPEDWTWTPQGGGPVGGGGPLGGGPVGPGGPGGPWVPGGGPGGPGGPVGGSSRTSPAGRKDSRQRILIIAAAAVVALIIVGVALFAAGVFSPDEVSADPRTSSSAPGDTSDAGTTSEPPTDTTPPSTDPPQPTETSVGDGPFPDKAEQHLMDRLSDDLTGTGACSRWTGPSDDIVFTAETPLAAIYCDAPSGSPPSMYGILFVEYRTEPAAEVPFLDYFDFPDKEGDQCVADWPMRDNWYAEGEDAPQGMFGCTVDEDVSSSFVVWTHDGVYASASAERGALHQLYGWWRKNDAAVID
jgi:hypothetical protein